MSLKCCTWEKKKINNEMRSLRIKELYKFIKMQSALKMYDRHKWVKNFLSKYFLSYEINKYLSVMIYFGAHV